MLIVADENIPDAKALFGDLGEVRCLPGRTLSRADVASAQVLLVRSVTPVNAALLQGSAVRFVGTATIGVDHIDTTWLASQGIGFASAPGSNARSVVEYVLAAMAWLGLHQDWPWRQARVGVVGMGQVGGRLVRQLQGLGLSVCAYDPLLPQNDPALVDLAQVLRCELVCLHTPLSRTGMHPTYHMLAAAQLQQLQSGAVLLNAGRGAVVDGTALREFLQRRRDVRAVLDVWENEPAIDPLLLAQTTLATPHIAGYSLDGKRAATRQLRQALAQYLHQPGDLGGAMDADPPSLLPVPGQLAPGVDAQFCQAILAAYDIGRDAAALTAVEPAQLAAGFDSLRKNYPVRREFAQYSLADWPLLPQARQLLLACGFKP